LKKNGHWGRKAEGLGRIWLGLFKRWINHYPADSVLCFVNTYRVDSVIQLSNNWALGSSSMFYPQCCYSSSLNMLKILKEFDFLWLLKGDNI